MPDYDYRCDHCEERWTITKGMNDPAPEDCHICDTVGTVQRLYSPAALKFVGEGFHCNDYASEKKIKDAERQSVVAYSPKDQHMMKRRGIQP